MAGFLARIIGGLLRDRTLTAGSGITITNPTGDAGDPTFAVGGNVSVDTATVTKDNIVNVSTDGFIAQNTIFSTSGVTVQMSPRLRFRSNVWATIGTINDTDDWILEALPVSAGTPTSEFHIKRSLAGGAYADVFKLQSGNVLTIGAGASGAFRAGDGTAASPVFGFVNSGGGGSIGFWTPAANDMNLVCNSANQILWGSSLWRNSSALLIGWSSSSDPNSAVADTAMIRQAAAKIKFYNKPESTPDAGFVLDFSTDAIAKFRDRTDANDAAIVASTLSVTGGQITFPAAQNPSAGANVLDDYEEQTWTPTDASGAGLTFTGVVASYVKIGQMVYASFQFTFPATASGAAILIGGLPFTVQNSGVSNWGGVFTYTTVGVHHTLLAVNNSTTFAVFTMAGVGVTNAVYTLQLFNGFLVYRATA